MANFKTGYQFAQDVIGVGNNICNFTMLMQYFPTRDSLPIGKSVAHGINQCAFIHFLKGHNLFDVNTFQNQDFSDWSRFDNIGSVIISPQGCSNSIGESFYISGINLPELFYDYILFSTISAYQHYQKGTNVNEYFVGSPKWFLRLAETKGFKVHNNATITSQSIEKSTKIEPTQLTNILYFS